MSLLLKPPNFCDSCKSLNIKLLIDKINRPEWPYFYGCLDCKASVGCHLNTNNPLGLMATTKTKRLRAKLHFLLDLIWKNNYLSRTETYIWLANELNIDTEIHISQLSNENLTKSIFILSAHNNNDYAQFKRRKEKNVRKFKEQIKRRNSKIVRRKFDR